MPTGEMRMEWIHWGCMTPTRQLTRSGFPTQSICPAGWIRWGSIPSAATTWWKVTTPGRTLRSVAEDKVGWPRRPIIRSDYNRKIAMMSDENGLDHAAVKA